MPTLLIAGLAVVWGLEQQGVPLEGPYPLPPRGVTTLRSREPHEEYVVPDAQGRSGVPLHTQCFSQPRARLATRALPLQVRPRLSGRCAWRPGRSSKDRSL